MSELTKFIIGPIEKQSYSGYSQLTKKQVFLANRAAEILENSSKDQWRDVKGVENPADIGTRGMSIEVVKEFGWLNG